MILDYSESTVKLYMLHNAMLQALRDKRYGDALEISQQCVDEQIKLQEWLRSIN